MKVGKLEIVDEIVGYYDSDDLNDQDLERYIHLIIISNDSPEETAKKAEQIKAFIDSL
ncbi:hypothetical protein JR552_001775 [Listeria monocytogenes serotype 1/2b]|uniref:hypothetical protein n=1 Tax=Listeria seeligeri TaxID=1640 RepID=UPI001889482C|nr:hypothetical protein [Listeria seeligeri]EHC6275917.1 hypothetical protein [Listeria monocytogenes serotype 1/2b]EIW3164984.1 hypothetical protein [Listeria monocytogenes]MBF2440357.1 hypothetical protein [Listeria seeligeri]